MATKLATIIIMHYSFKLQYPKKNKLSPILFSSYFKEEGKKFVYSTGVSIHPSDWDFENIQPKNLTGRDKDVFHRKSVQNQLSKFSSKFMEIVNRFKTIDEVLTTEQVREEFNVTFKKTASKTKNVFAVYDMFLKDKESDQTDQANSPSTIKRYEYNKKLLQTFAKDYKYSLRFNTINKKFYNAFIKYCVEEKKHSANTLSRNIGLFKTFMYWAIENKYTYNDEFKQFKNIQRFKTDEVALTKAQIEAVYHYDLIRKKKLIKVRDLFVFGASTGMRYSNYSKVRKKDVNNNFINVIDAKDNSKSLRIPLNKYSREILIKYDYDLPRISNQKFNDYLKELFALLGFNKKIKKTMKYGKNIVETEDFFYDRISSHTARRSFITIMKNEGVPDKVIMSYTGHRSLEVFNNYYRPNENHRIKFMESVWS
ncbi:tyrosine-type recombinase/integrase [Formosa sp. PL04]|uniref:tyrosine-type recombinase/integrase n=1 Tax=Formosa sp. PL04 TaxID=3081755 RepID=UPI002982A44C|nr:tyrosine-type recombinase/integrase [Formosa sp. PL04]MDW5290934.1 tyrosine-type recombinase/integrase [Formosa sp. PL04]